MRRALMVVSTFVALVALGVPGAAGQEATPTMGEQASVALARTEKRFVVPFGLDGLNTGLSVQDTVTGTCTGDSIALPDRADAFACLEGSQIYDPCFAESFPVQDEPGEVACVPDPFASEVVVLTLDSPLPMHKEVPAGKGIDAFAPWDLPWGLELANGDRCTLLGGTLYQLGGQTVYYGCEQNGAILGVVDHEQPVWTVNYLADGAAVSDEIAVTAVWS